MYIPVSEYILGATISINRELSRHLAQNKLQLKEDITIKKDNVTVTVKTLKKSYLYTYNLVEHEADGYSLLSILGFCLATEFENQYPDMNFYYHSQILVTKPGMNPSADGGIIINGLKIPIMIFVYKCHTSHSLGSVFMADIVELLLQSYYCIKYYNLSSIVSCLTNLDQWHIFLFMYEEGQLKVKYYYS